MAKFVNIEEVCKEIFAGGDAPKEHMSLIKTDEYSIPIYSNGEVNNGLYGFTNYARVFEPSITISARGTIGYATIRNEPFLPIVRLITLVPKPELIDLQYLYFAVQNYHFSGNGTSIPQLTVPMLKAYSFPLPSMDSQRIIACTLKKVNFLLDIRKQQLSKLDELVKARFVEMFGDPVTNPKNLEIVSLSKIADFFNGLTYTPSDVSKNGTIVLRSSNIQNGMLDFTDTVRVSCAIKDKYMVQDNDILMCSRNGSARLVGKVAPINNISEPMCFGAFMIIVRSKYAPYLLTYFQTDAFRGQIKTGATTTINQITVQMLNNVFLPIPTIQEVEGYSAYLYRMEKCKLTIQQGLDKLEILKKALMQEYFG